MTSDCFENQLKRLIARFGDKSFDSEFTRLVGREMSSTPNDDFIRIVDTMIGTRPAHKPPLLTDFREQRLQCEKDRLAKESRWAAEEIERSRVNLPDILEKHYGKISSIKEAIEIERLKIKAQQADDEKEGA